MARNSFIYVNTDELVEFPRPISHKVVNIAGMGMEKSLEKRGQLDKVSSYEFVVKSRFF